MATSKKSNGRGPRTGALRESEELFRTMADTAPVMIWLSGSDGQRNFFNKGWLDFRGRALEEELGEGWAEGVHPEDAERLAGVIKAAFDERRPYTTEYRLRRRDGRYRWIFANGVPRHSPAGEFQGFIGTCIDNDDRKRAEEQLERRARQAALGADVGVALAESGVALRHTLQRCAESVVTHLDAAFARIWTLDEGRRGLELQASAGMYTHTDGPHGRVPVGKFKIGLIAEERRPHLTNSVVGDPRVGDQEWARREGMVSFAGYPLVVEDRLVGVLAMFARRPLPDDTLEALSSVSNTIAQGIERKRADEALKAYARERERMFEEVSTPVVPVLEGVLVVPLVGSLDTRRMERATKAALEEVTRTGARAVILDITGARVVDSHAVANLGNLVAALKLVGAEALVTGVSAHAAQSLVGLGLDLQGLRTHRTLAQALARLIKSRGRQGSW